MITKRRVSRILPKTIVRFAEEKNLFIPRAKTSEFRLYEAGELIFRLPYGIGRKRTYTLYVGDSRIGEGGLKEVIQMMKDFLGS